MAQHQQAIVTYECDECGTAVSIEVDAVAIHPPPPTGWVTIASRSTSQDLFCSWECVGVVASKKAKERDERAKKVVKP